MRPLSTKIPDACLPRLWDGTQLEYRFPFCISAELWGPVGEVLVDRLALSPARMLVDNVSLIGAPGRVHTDSYYDESGIPPDADLLREYDLCMLHTSAEVGVDFFEVCATVKTLVVWPTTKYFDPDKWLWRGNSARYGLPSPTSLRRYYNCRDGWTPSNVSIANGDNFTRAYDINPPRFPWAGIFANP